MPAWWSELKAIPEVKDLQKLTCKIQPSFYTPKVRMRASLEQGYTVPPAPKCLNRNAFLLDELSYQDVWQQLNPPNSCLCKGPAILAEKLNLLRSLDLRPLAGSVVELRETVQEYLTFDHWDVVQGLGVIHLGSTSQWPQATLLATCCHCQLRDRIFETTTHPLPPLQRKT